MPAGPRTPGSARRPSAPPRRERSTRHTGRTAPALDIRVRILDGASAGTEYAIAGSVVRIGRSDDNDIVLPDSNASRNHAELVRDGSGRYLVRDLGSRNGILVNRKKTPQALLKNGDKVTIGSTTIEFVSDADGAPAGGAAKRWLVVAVGAGLVGFLLVSFGGGGGGKGAGAPAAGPIVITAATPDGAAAGNPTPPPVVTQDGVSIASLFATAQTVPPGNPKGSEVGRNSPTKAVPGAVATPALNLPPGTSNEKMIAAIMAEGDRAYNSGKLVDARAYFDRAVKLDPNCERCVNRYDSVDRQIQKEIQDSLAAGFTYMETQRWDQAINAFEKVKFLDPDPASVNNGTATASIDEAKRRKASGGR